MYTFRKKKTWKLKNITILNLIATFQNFGTRVVEPILETRDVIDEYIYIYLYGLFIGLFHVEKNNYNCTKFTIKTKLHRLNLSLALLHKSTLGVIICRTAILALVLRSIWWTFKELERRFGLQNFRKVVSNMKTYYSYNFISKC